MPKNIIWATGYQSDYDWIQIPNIFNRNEKPVHVRGVTAEPGVYFLGLSWQYRRGSALLSGVEEDAKHLISRLQ